MKKIIFLVTTIAAQLFHTQCDAVVQTINLTTGTTAVGSNDPVWTVKAPGSGTFGNAIVSNGVLLEVATGTQRNYLWTTNSCGKWISPHTVTTPGTTYGNVPDIAGLAGDYTYRLMFYNSHHCAVSAMMNFSVAGDNKVTSIKMNSSPAHTLNATYSSLTGYSFNVLSELAYGFNTIDVTVNNTDFYTGLLLCGNIVIDYGDGIVPVVSGSTSFCQGDALTFNGNSSTGTIQNHFWEIAECDAAGNYTNPSAVWQSWFTGFPAPINFSTTSFASKVECGKYYRVKLAISNSCISWAENTKIIYIKCKPTLFVHNPDTVCQGSSVLLSVNGNATSYTWGAPINQTTNSVYVTANTNTSYTVTGTLNGCTTSATVPVYMTPSSLDINLSTGVNTSGALISSGTSDDTWKRRGIPGAIYTAPYASLSAMKVVNAHTGTPAWATSPTAKWLSLTSSSGNAVEENASQTDNTPNHDNDYWFETQFQLPVAYSNLRMEVEYAVDNDITILLNSEALSGNNTNIEYTLSNHFDSQFNTLHNLGTIATNQSHYILGTNTLLVRVYNGGGGITGNASYMGLLLNAHVKGECLPQFHRSEDIIADEEMVYEQTAATTFLYPNPSQGSFSIENADRVISGITVRDALGRVVKTMADLNTNSIKVELNNGTKGFYFVEITYSGQPKPVIKKMIIE